MKQYRIIWLITIFLQSYQLIGSESKHLFEFSAGSFKTVVSDLASSDTFRELYYLYDVLPLLNSSNEERRQLGLIKSSQFQTSEILNTNFRLGYEYRIFSFLGLGSSYQYNRVIVTDVLSGDYAILPRFGISPPEPNPSPPDPANFNTLFPRTLRSKITSLELEATFHLIPSSKNWDPYFRLGYGTALEGVFGPSEKISYSLGNRYYINNIHWLIEFNQSELYGNLGRTDFAVDSGFRLGGGVRYP